MNHFLGLATRLGKLIVFFGALMCLPALVSMLYQDGLAMVYLKHAAAISGAGLIMAVAGGRFKAAHFGLRQGFLLVTIIWTLLPALAALPLYSTLPDLSFPQAYFEAASGLTATGATVLTNIDNLPPSLNFWRGEMIWLGGMGLIVLVVAVLPLISAGNAAMMQTELPGPTKEERLTPQIAQTAKSLWLVYAVLTAICAIAYYVAGMSPLDAIIHAMTTLGLGGFSSHDANYAYFDSPLIEAIAVFFMIIAGINFALHVLVCKRKSMRFYWHNLECRAYFIAIAAITTTIVLYLYFSGYYEEWTDAIRYGVFNTISVITTTGYSNADYGAWPLFAPLSLLILANFISCSGSTGGGIKMQRTLLALYQTGAESQKNLHPQTYYTNKAGPSMQQKDLISVLFFIIAYAGSALILILLLISTGMDFTTGFSAALATISNTGPGLGDVGPASNYGGLTVTQTWLCAFAMLLGRLELLSFLVLLRRSFWTY